MLQQTNPQVPVFSAFLFTFLTVSLIFAGIKKLTHSYWGLLASAFLLTFPYFTKLALSQYSDIVVGFYLLISLVCLIIGKSENKPSFYFLAGIFLGFLSFTKSEGLMAAALLLGLTLPYLWIKNPSQLKKKMLLTLGMGTFLALIPAAIFYIAYAPDNQTFINGLTSPSHPTNLGRLKIILSFYLIEFGGTPVMYLMQLKNIESLWNTTWVILLAGLLLGWKRILHRDILIIPLFLLSYGLVITFYYMLNTYFEITWWLQVTLHRLAFSTLPSAIFWVFYSLFKKETSTVVQS
jgi:4-amino-4-deoxy-L-arabinose transferase-like glycosyltransferase